MDNSCKKKSTLNNRYFLHEERLKNMVLHTAGTVCVAQVYIRTRVKTHKGKNAQKRGVKTHP